MEDAEWTYNSWSCHTLSLPPRSPGFPDRPTLLGPHVGEENRMPQFSPPGNRQGAGMFGLPVAVQVKHGPTVAKRHPGKPVLHEFPDGAERAVFHLKSPVIFKRGDPVYDREILSLLPVERRLLLEPARAHSLVTIRSPRARVSRGETVADLDKIAFPVDLLRPGRCLSSPAPSPGRPVPHKKSAGSPEVPTPIRGAVPLVEALEDFQGVGLGGPRVPQREGEPTLPSVFVNNLLDLSGRGPDDLQGAPF